MLVFSLEDEVPGPSPIGQVNIFKNYLPTKKIYLCQTTGQDVFQALSNRGVFWGRVIKVIKTESFRKLSNFNFQRTKTLDQNSKQGLQV